MPYVPPAGESGSLTVTADTATAIPSTLATRRELRVQNLDGSAIYVGFTSEVDASNGIKIAANETLVLPVGYGTADGPTLYAYSSAGTAANAVRWMAVS
jgi:hypothetical protein